MQRMKLILKSDFDIRNCECKKHLDVKFDYKLTFNSLISDLCKNANQKINALATVAPYMSISKACILMNAFLKLQFNYCSLV